MRGAPGPDGWLINWTSLDGTKIIYNSQWTAPNIKHTIGHHFNILLSWRVHRYTRHVVRTQSRQKAIRVAVFFVAIQYGRLPSWICPVPQQDEETTTVFQRRGGDNFDRSGAVVSGPGLWHGAVDLSENVLMPLAGMPEVSV